MRVKMFGASLLLLCALITPSFAGDITLGKPDGDITLGRAGGVTTTNNDGDITLGFAGVLISDLPVIISDLIGKLPRG